MVAATDDSTAVLLYQIPQQGEVRFSVLLQHIKTKDSNILEYGAREAGRRGV